STPYAGSVSVAGYVYGRWALSSYDGHLRVATTNSPPWGDGPASSSRVTALAERSDGLVETGRVDGLGPGEWIYAVRYFGELATVVTFRQTDPLYVLDLADPAAPRLLGELKVPGFSTYLHPVGDDRLLGVGQDADARGRVTGLQVSLFDLSDLSRPVQLDRLPLGTGHSLALEDSRAFGYDPERRLALLPVSTYDEGTGRNEAVGVRVGADGSLERAGGLALGPDVQVERVLHDRDHIYALTRTGVVAARAGDFTRTGSVALPR
ncbi:MAG: beta-propeller domain-containing protein, partial [Actinomycetota bacterium]|nr:beta-propeller domain-containing protein [Actinomycetota bacterium]